MCSGESEWCPIDTYKHDGLPCNNHGEAFCYNGKCNSHNSQCKVVWGDDQETKKSDDICYEKRNDARKYISIQLQVSLVIGLLCLASETKDGIIIIASIFPVFV